MAATSHPLATQSAMDVLKAGGNAVDAALAASATLCVVEPHMTGVGGDCFAIIAEPDGTTCGLNASGRTGRKLDPQMLRDKGFEKVPVRGVNSITIPGAVAGWQKLADRFATMSFDRLFADAIGYAENGYPVHDRVARDWALLVPDIIEQGSEESLLLDGRAPTAASRHTWPALGRTLQRIAKQGAEAFYQGEVAADIAATIKLAGGVIDEEDIAATSADWVDLISAQFARHDILEIPPNGQGITALILMRLLEKLGAPDLTADSIDRWHMEIEAGRMAYAVRDHLVADPSAMTIELEQLLSDDYIDALAIQFDPKRRNNHIDLPAHPDAGTVYLTVVDRDRMAISFINSVYNGFGSLVVAEESGIVLQNRGACFSLEPGHPNEIGPNKRPMHTIIPGMVIRNGKPAITFGVMGGSYQPMGQAHVLSNILLHGMDPQAALDHSRLFWDDAGTIRVEENIPESIRRSLTSLGHRIDGAVSPWGGGQIIVMDNADGFLRGGSDFRKDGCVMGW